MHIGQLDLNLIVHLDALLSEGHVTRAALRVGLSQSAMSRSLARLRSLLADPLLVRGRRGMERTPRAVALEGPLRRALEGLGAVVLERPTFDPATAKRTFTMTTVDYGEALFLPPLLARVSREAPGVDLAVDVARDQAAALEEAGLDLALGPRRGGGAQIVWKRLFHESFVCVVRRRHPVLRARGGLTLARYLELGHVLVAPGGKPGSLVDDALTAIGKTRRVAVRVPSFLVAPLVVAGSDLLATLPGRLARRLAKSLPVSLLPPPLPLAGFDMYMAWHERHRSDASHRWYRTLVADVAARLDE